MSSRTLTHDAESPRRSPVSFVGRLRGMVVIAAAALALTRLGFGESQFSSKVAIGLGIVFVFVLVGSLFERDDAQQRQI